MNMQTAYPVFEASQVLTSTQLNDLTEYLEQQDRLSRRTLAGIGVLCGFTVDAEGGTVSISSGIAVSSEGFLIAADAQAYNRFRPYEVPVPTAEEASEAEIAEARYPFLFPDGDTQIPVFELLDTDFAPAPGEADPAPLTAAFLADKTVMLFLECRLQSLKSCDINDCSDKGAERRFTLRRLLLTRAQADAMLAREAEIAQRPVDRHNHPRNELPYLRVEKLALARTGAASFGDLLLRIVSIALKLGSELPAALRDAYSAYGYLLQDLYVEGEDPFPDSYFSNVWGQLALNILMVQYFYDYMRDVAMAYNEFVQSAALFEAECLPDPRRFPKHVLLGDAVDAPDAFTVAFSTPADVAAFDQFSAGSGAGLTPRPAPRRSHFVPSPACQNQPRLEEVRALFLRMHLLALNFRLQGGLLAPIRLTPSRGGAAPLSERAIPFHYAFTRDTQLFRNWSPRKVRQRLLNTVYSYQFSAPNDEHPLHFRLDDQDFIRIEGIVGKPLGSAMAELVAYKQALGVSFSIEPVFMRLATSANDGDGIAMDQQSATRAAEALRRMLLCRMSDLDVIFLILIGAIFALLVFLVRSIGRLRPMAVPAPSGDTPAGREFAVEFAEAAQPAATAFFDRATAARFARAIPPEQEAELKIDADRLRGELRSREFRTGEVIAQLNSEPENDSAAAIYARVSNDAAGGNLFDRTRALVLEQGGDDAAVQRTYAHTAMLDQIENLMGAMNVRSVADFEEQRFATAYRGFAQSFDNYAAVARETPVRDPAQLQTQAQIVSAAGAVTGQVGAFAAGNLQAEFTAAVRGLFEELTLGGFASRNPGLEHHAGVPAGGTFVMAYVSRADLARHLREIMAANNQPVARVSTTFAAGRAQPAAETAITAATAAAAVRTEDPLDDFIVLADFCLPYRCCDADCSDVILSEQITADPFGDAVDPGPMAVPPVDGEENEQPGRPPGGIGVPGRGDITGLIREVTGPLSTATALARPGAAGLPQRPGRFDPPPEPDRPPVDPPTPEPDRPTPDRDPRRPAREQAVLSGVVGVQRRDTLLPLRNASVLLVFADGTQRRESTENGEFSVTIPAGDVEVRGQAARHRGRTQRLSLRPGEQRSIELVMTPTG
jgi:hypothetical protein